MKVNEEGNAFIIVIMLASEWHCRLPDCLKNRRKRRDCEDSYSDFCSSEHAVSFSKAHCIQLYKIYRCRGCRTT